MFQVSTGSHHKKLYGTPGSISYVNMNRIYGNATLIVSDFPYLYMKGKIGRIKWSYIEFHVDGDIVKTFQIGLELLCFNEKENFVSIMVG